MQDLEFPASSRHELCMTRLETHIKWQVLYDFTFHMTPNQDGGNSC